VLGEWVVLHFDERRQRTSAESAFALVAYRQERRFDEVCYRFAYCLTPKLERFAIEYADGPFRGSEISPLPMIWLPPEIIVPLDKQARPLRGDELGSNGNALLAHYERRAFCQGHKYFITKVALAPSVQPPASAA
jgi:hypothetical protein